MALLSKDKMLMTVVNLLIIIGAVSASFYVVPSNIVFKDSFINDFKQFCPSGVLEPKMSFKDASSVKLTGNERDILDKNADAKDYSAKFSEFNSENPYFDGASNNSILKKVSSYVITVVGINFLYLAAIVLASFFSGIIGSVAVSAISSAAVYYFYTFRELPNLALQLKTCFFFTHAASQSSEVASIASKYYDMYNVIENIFKFDMQLKIGIFIGVAVLSSILFDRRTIFYVSQLEEKMSECLRLQAENSKLQSNVGDVRKMDEKFRMISARMSSIQTLTRVVTKSMDPTDVIKESLKVVQQIVNAEKCSFWLLDENGTTLVLKECIGWKDEEKENLKTSSAEDAGLVGAALRAGKVMTSSESRQPDYTAMGEGAAIMNSKACAPLKHGEKMLGIINVEKFSDSTKMEQEETRMLELISTLSSVAIENANLFKKTEMLANTDGLTKLYTRRYMDSFLEAELEKSRRYNHPLSVALTDIDHFKSFNDTYGHQIGDFVLEETAKILRNAVRNVDLAARYGGEEFLAILPETDYKGAFTFAERLRKKIEDKTYEDAKTGHKLKVTISIGVASFPLHSKEKAELVKKADTALYLAKEQGRNRVKVAPITKEQLANMQKS